MNRKQQQAPILDHQRVAQDTYRLRLRAPGIASRARAGQFVMVRVARGLDPLLRRPFSLHRIHPESGVIELLYRVVGRGTWLLSQRGPGEIIDCLGPLGNYFRLPAVRKGRVGLIAGGIGIAPLVALLDSLSPGGADVPDYRVSLFYGAKSGAELLAADFFEPFTADLHFSTDDGTLGCCGRVTDLLEAEARSHPEPFVMLYSCGNLAMQYQVSRWAAKGGYPLQLSLEAMMACGMGACLGCALPARGDRYLHVCKQGPIFEPGQIQWDQIQPPSLTPPTFVCR